jgi:hypothetical protein
VTARARVRWGLPDLVEVRGLGEGEPLSKDERAQGGGLLGGLVCLALRRK